MDFKNSIHKFIRDKGACQLHDFKKWISRELKITIIKFWNFKIFKFIKKYTKYTKFWNLNFKIYKFLKFEFQNSIR